MTGRSLQVARGLNTIAARIVKNQAVLSDYGITLNNADGSMKSTYEILSELAKAWTRMGDEERVTVGTTIAGINQYKVLAAVMENFQTALDAVEVSENAYGSAMRENARYMESYEAKVTALKAAWQNLSTSVIEGGLVKGILDVATAMVNFVAQSDLLSNAIGGLASTFAIFGGVQLVKVSKFIPVLIGQFKNFGTVVKALKAGSAGLGEALATVGGEVGVMGGIMGSILPVIAGVVAAIVALKTAYDVYQKAQYEASFENQNNILQDMTKSYESQIEEIKKLEAKGDSLTEHERIRLEYLKQQTQEIENQNKIQKQQDKTFKALEREIAKTTVRYDGVYGLDQRFQVSTSDFLDVIEVLQDGSKTTQDYQQSLVAFKEKWKDTVEQAEYFRDVLKKDLSPETELLINQYHAVNNSLEQFAAESGTSVDAIIDQYKEFETLENKIDKATQALERFNATTASDHGEALEGYQKAFAQFKEDYEAGKMGASSIQAMIDLVIPPENQQGLVEDAKAVSESIIGQILSAEDPLRVFSNYIQTNQEGLKGIVDIVDGGFTLSSYEDLAKAMGTTEEAILAIFDAIQLYNGQQIITGAETEDLISRFSEMDGASLSLSNAVAAVQEITGETDPSKIADFLNILKEAGEIPFTGTIDGVQRAQDILAKAQKDKDEFTEDDSVSIEVIVNDEALKSAYGVLQAMDGYVAHVTIQTNSVEGEFATGTSNFKGGLALVNDGAKVNGSAKELIVDNGRAFMMPSEPALVNLDKGATIYTARETQGILGGIPAFAAGIGAGGGIIPRPPEEPKTPPAGSVISLPDLIDKIVGSVGGGHSGGGGGSSGEKRLTDEQAKKEFEKWLKEEKHLLAMDEITEEQYYDDLEEMMEKYLANREGLIEEYWKYEEEVYKYRKKALEDVIDLEERLNDLARAKTQKVLVYKDGMFQYVNNVEAIANAQNALAKALSKNAGASADLGGGFGTDMTAKIATIGTSGDTFNIGEVTLSDVSNVNDIFDGLKNLAIQQSAK